MNGRPALLINCTSRFEAFLTLCSVEADERLSAGHGMSQFYASYLSSGHFDWE